MMSGDVTMHPVSGETIVPGRGLETVGVGDTGEDILRVLHEPEEGSRGNWLAYRAQHGLDFFLKDGRVGEMRFNLGFMGKTTHGIGIGARLDDALEASGGARKTVSADSKTTQGVREGSDRVLYEQQEPKAYKFIDGGHGILYWADSHKRITQIVTFKPYGPGS